LNAVVDLIASERYIGSRYGSPYHIPGLLSGRYQGYAEGGYIDHPQFALLGEKGPEYVIPAHRMTGATVHLHLNVNGDVYADDLEDIILDTVAQAIDRKVAV
jgi:SLT domain-containing protein